MSSMQNNMNNIKQYLCS